MNIIDLRSDTVTRPTTKMLQAMMGAKVGDDVYKEDPTVIELQLMIAGMFGYESALFCPSGTMANQIAIKLHTQPGDEVICGDLSHVYHYEGGGIAFNSGASVRLIKGDRGRFTAEQVAQNINDPEDYHLAFTRLIVAENTCNKGGGSVWNVNELQKISTLAKAHNLKFHLDGARIFNAMTYDQSNPAMYGSMFDSISVCLSKGLGAPVGSVLLGNQDFIKKAVRVRKLLGGAMRQAGYLAAAGIFALNNNIERLAEDHYHARLLGQKLMDCSWVQSVEEVQSNIVMINLRPEISDQDVIYQLKKKGILVSKFGPGIIRLVTHLDISSSMVDHALDSFQSLRPEKNNPA